MCSASLTTVLSFHTSQMGSTVTDEKRRSNKSWRTDTCQAASASPAALQATIHFSTTSSHPAFPVPCSSGLDRFQRLLNGSMDISHSLLLRIPLAVIRAERP